MLETYIIYILIVGIVGSFVSWSKAENHNLRNIFFRVIDGCFSAYVVYEIAYYFTTNEKLSLAICGVGAFSGSDMLVSLKEFALNFFQRKI
ncbi:hypothetical protein CPIN18021_0286 [Campylobacter pinnipediorum subsp. caledonicus]|uniref:Uncharacterized protein n=1 Tax=Campylobacter pinnipediorum subsp. caledonicus TaxID=1874362 RepID=A0A1S6U611_9BACT|nr:phage holin family protein [Campylobacter pinnipediorum]AQW85548.1 hypothetical protein CPIN18020_0307 [Campylobacter pinnipediorum subsp. caledonicus]AQW87133.1 hypothetical protein CPIN18021_0286 [Campylobacter pinnipediorum subsp. caledonicus]OPA71831.1 hypothetical protein BB381_06755 [Campylobacter pinnipediorum subsp. caledonicus]